MSTKNSPWTPETLAHAVMELWQEQLSAYAEDTRTRDDLTKMVEPFSQLFAVWTTMMQNPVHGQFTTASAKAKTGPTAPAAQRPASTSATSMQREHAMAELAARLDAIEARLRQFEQAATRADQPQATAAPARTPRSRRKPAAGKTGGGTTG